jgi:hypothetical protein
MVHRRAMGLAPQNKVVGERNDSIGGALACQTSEPQKNVWAKK